MSQSGANAGTLLAAMEIPMRSADGDHPDRLVLKHAFAYGFPVIG